MEHYFCFSKSGEKNIRIYSFDESHGDQLLVFRSFDKNLQPIELNISLSDSDIEDLQLNQSNLEDYAGHENSHSRNEYISYVKSAIETIKKSDIQKIVTSRFITIDNQHNLISVYRKLVAKYPSSNVYFINHPLIGCWMGSTPELLLKLEDSRIETMALAGTKRHGEKWTPKELTEQSLVTDYIRSKLEESHCSSINTHGPYTVTAGPVSHLQTKIEANISKGDEDELIESLHPTPAVCGIPLDDSLNFILKNEGYNRSFYTGYWGIKQNNSFEAYVNLRCLQAFKTKLVLYAGGGILENSEAEKEYQETELKLNTLLSVLNT